MQILFQADLAPDRQGESSTLMASVAKRTNLGSIVNSFPFSLTLKTGGKVVGWHWPISQKRNRALSPKGQGTTMLQAASASQHHRVSTMDTARILANTVKKTL